MARRLDPSALRIVATAVCLIAPAIATAHPARELHPETGWTFEPWVVLCIVASAFLYASGLKRLWSHAGVGNGVARWQAACFAGGIAIVVIALMSPLDALGSYLFSAHMVQHELLMIAAAPLLVMSKPLAVWSWSLPPRVTHLFAGDSANPLVRVVWQVVTYAPFAWLVHGVALWAWHAPAFFDAALRNESIHTLQHASFFVTALLFWWAPLGATSRTQRGAALIYLFTTMVHTTVLGALLTVAPGVWYGAYADRPESFGLSPLEDQQLGGLIMWVPGGISYLAASLAIAWQSLKRKDDSLAPQASH